MGKFAVLSFCVLISAQALGAEIYLKCEAVDKKVTKYVSMVEAEIIYNRLSNTASAKYRHTGKNGAGEVGKAKDYQHTTETPIFFYTSNGTGPLDESLSLDKESMEVGILRGTTLWEGTCEAVENLSWFKDRGF